MIYALLTVASAYLLGSLPTAFIFGKVLKGIDIREHGSGNVGATNAGRVLGKGPALCVFAIDLLKGYVSVTFIPSFWNGIFPSNLHLNSSFYLVLAIAVVGGHIWTCFLKFKGGKGVATTAGAMLGIYPAIFVSAMIVWLIAFNLWKYVSVSSILSAISLPIISVIVGEDLITTIFMAIICMVGVFSHRENIKRLIKGTESRAVSMKKR